MNRTRRCSTRGQSIIEYLIVAAALIGAFTAFGAFMTTGVTAVGEDAKTAMQKGGDAIEGIVIGPE